TDGFIDKDYLIDASKQFGTTGEFKDPTNYPPSASQFRYWLRWTGGVIKFPDGNSVTTVEQHINVTPDEGYDKVYIYVDTASGSLGKTMDWGASINPTRVLLAVAKPGYSYTDPTTGATR